MKKLFITAICICIVTLMFSCLTVANAETPAADPTVDPAVTPVPTDVPIVTIVPTAVPTEISVVTVVSTATPTPTNAPAATATPTPTNVPAPSTTPTATPVISVASTDPVYPLAQMVEGITASTKATTDGKTEITFSIPNVNVGGLKILTSKNISALVKSVTSARDHFVFKTSSNKTSAKVNYTMSIAANTSAQVDLKLVGMISSTILDQFKQAVIKEIGQTIINQTSAALDLKIKSLNQDLKKLKDSLKPVQKKQNASQQVASINDKINTTTADLNQFIVLKKAVDAYKAKYGTIMDKKNASKNNKSGNKGSNTSNTKTTSDSKGNSSSDTKGKPVTNSNSNGKSNKK